MEPPKITTLFDLLAKGLTVAQLATAIETHGIFGWDRFGRFFSPGEPPNKKLSPEALDALATFNEYQVSFYEERDATYDGESMDLTAAIDVLDGTQSTALNRLGWLEGKLPDFPIAEAFTPPPRPRRKATPESPTLRVLGALLLHLQDLRKSGKTMRIPSEDTLIGDMATKFDGHKWLSRTTIGNNFTDAKKAFPTKEGDN